MKKSIFLAAATMLVGCGADQGELTDVQEPLGQSQHALLLTNGGLESGAPMGSIYTMSAGSTALTGWGIGGSVDRVSNGYWQAAEGSYSIDLNGTGPGYIDQYVATTPGKPYRIAFWLAGNPAYTGADPVRYLRVYSGNVSYRDFTFDTTGYSGSNMGWVRRFHDFTANSTSTRIIFESGSPGAGGPALDGIIVYETY